MPSTPVGLCVISSSRKRRDATSAAQRLSYGLAVPPRGVDFAQIVTGPSKARVETQRAFEMSGGLIELALTRQCDAKTVMRAGMIGIRSQRFVVMGDGVVELALA